MRKYAIAVVSALSLAFAAVPASATDWGFGGGGFAGGMIGAGQSSSGASNWSDTRIHGSATAQSGSMSFGQAESGFGIGVGSLPNGDPAGGAFGNFVGANVGSGSQSTASTTANGGGNSWAGSSGTGYGTTVLGGAGLGLGGYVSTGN